VSLTLDEYKAGSGSIPTPMVYNPYLWDRLGSLLLFDQQPLPVGFGYCNNDDTIYHPGEGIKQWTDELASQRSYF
jgi:hypothetical protein